jgi:lipopolysaccharide transport system ATP-binding protein
VINLPSRHIGIVGTFDVQNYGDLLFPLLAEAELSRRLGPIHLHRLSYHAREAPPWPYPVTSLTELPELLNELDGLLIGGGFIIRFDKFVAPDYESPSPYIHHPTGYWLTPALMALQQGKPLVWNAPGMHCNPIPDWAAPLLRLALEHSACVRVRDALSCDALQAICPNAQIEVLPDTAFALPRLLNDKQPSNAFTRLCNEVGLGPLYIVIHALSLAEPYIRMLENDPEAFAEFQIVLIPIGPVIDDDSALLAARLPQAIRLPFWPDPLLLAEILANAQALIGYSYHLAITGLVFGVPVFCLADMSCGKYTALARFPGLHTLAPGQPPSVSWFLQYTGKADPSEQACAAMQALDDYWDQTAALIKRGRSRPAPPFAAFWQDLPNLLEDPAQSSWLQLREQLARSEAQVQLLKNSRSLRLTAPLRVIGSALRRWKKTGEPC